MNASRIVCINENGGYYSFGCSFPEEKWIEILDIYWRLIFENDGGDVSPTMLSAAAKISWGSADKAIIYGQIGLIPTVYKKGHGKKGVGSLLQFEMAHHLYIYELYLRNPSRPLKSYCMKLEGKYGLSVCESTIQKWFHSIGPFKGTMCLTSRYPPGKNSWETRFFHWRS